MQCDSFSSTEQDRLQAIYCMASNMLYRNIHEFKFDNFKTNSHAIPKSVCQSKWFVPTKILFKTL